MHNVIASCPICKHKLKVTKLKCESCNSEITGEFSLSPFDLLDDKQKNFALLFILCEGNIKEIERRMNISYPTVKKYLDEVKLTLGFKEGNIDSSSDKNIREILKEKLKNNEITFEEVESILGEKLWEKNIWLI